MDATLVGIGEAELVPLPLPRGKASGFKLGRFLRASLLPVSVYVSLLVFWQFWVWYRNIPGFLVPTPLSVGQSLISRGPDILTALAATFQSALIGFCIGTSLGISLAILVIYFRPIERIFYPLLIAKQCLPAIVIAPIFVVWLGPGRLAIGAITVWVVFASVVYNTINGLKSTDHNLLAMAELYGARRWEVMFKLRVRAALPYILTGLQIASGSAVVGTVFAEFVAGTGGLKGGVGYLLQIYASKLDMSALFACAVALTAVGLCIFYSVRYGAHRSIGYWHESAVKREY